MAQSALLFLASDRYTLSDDWFLAVMVVFATATGFAVGAWYRVGLLGVALAGLVGMMLGGWLGVQVIGSYEYTVPTPREHREIRIIANGKERVVELKHVPEETVKRVPVGGGLGVLVGFGVGAFVFAWLTRPAAEVAAGEDDDLNAEPPSVAGRPGP